MDKYTHPVNAEVGRYANQNSWNENRTEFQANQGPGYQNMLTGRPSTLEFHLIGIGINLVENTVLWNPIEDID